VLPDGGAVPKPAERATWLKLLKPLAKVDDVVAIVVGHGAGLNLRSKGTKVFLVVARGRQPQSPIVGTQRDDGLHRSIAERTCADELARR
jgi:hypothetical protein